MYVTETSGAVKDLQLPAVHHIDITCRKIARRSKCGLPIAYAGQATRKRMQEKESFLRGTEYSVHDLI